MTTFFFWSGVALWSAIGIFVAWIVGYLALNAIEATIFMWRVVRLGGIKKEVPRMRRPVVFAKCVWRHTLRPARQGVEVAGRYHVAWPHIWPRRNREVGHAG